MTVTETPPELSRHLRLNYSGRIIDHLGLQMYQSPVAAVAELVANAWDADAENVWITLPDSINPLAEIVIKDDGNGMKFDDCQNRFLNVGFARRGNNPVERSPAKTRKILGRKGIGKFAGFGIAELIRIETISNETGESTIFEMNISKLRADEYVTKEGSPVDLIQYQEPEPDRRTEHGTIVRLQRLNLSQRRDPVQFSRSMARRFLLQQQAGDFKVFVNAAVLSDDENLVALQFSFPRDYRESERPAGMSTENDWGIETVANAGTIKWRIRFYEEPINDEEFRGVAVFANGKLVQAPFFFNLSGGLPGQHGQQYVSGQVEADYLDEQADDLVAPERQRVSWEHERSLPLLAWGQSRIRQLLGIWRARRGESRQRELEQKVLGFSNRLASLETHEQRTVTRALRRLAEIDTLSQSQFDDLGDAMLTAWEQGRLHDLIDHIAETDELTADALVAVLAEAQILTALNTAEAIKTKLRAVGGLKQRIERKELENAVRDYIAQNPWLVSAEWETFMVEKSLDYVLDAARVQAGLAAEDMSGRIDLALSSGEDLLVLEFMRPGLTINWDHIGRFERYVLVVREHIRASTGSTFNRGRVTGYIIADRLERTPEIIAKLEALRPQRMYALDWQGLFATALAQWAEFLRILVVRNPNDERLQALLEPSGSSQAAIEQEHQRE